MKIAILGAGLTGVELGRRLKECRKDFIIIERNPDIGGLCRTNKTGGYCWDFGIHAIYSRNKEIMDYFCSLPLDYEHLNRNVKIYHSGRNKKKYILEYPFESGVKNLPLNDRLECIQGYLSVRAKGKKIYSNLEEWINNRLGAGIAKHFMIPYNNKIWNCKLSDISEKLVCSKIEPVSAIHFMLSALGKNITGREYQAKFIYPKEGIQKLIDYTAKDIKDNILLNSDVERLIKCNNKWTIVYNGGKVQKANFVISTIPLVELLKKIDIDGLEKEYDVFRWNNTYFVMIGLKKGCDFQLIENCHWAFFKEDEIFYRITLMHNLSSGFLPVLVAEVSQKGDALDKSQEEIKNLVIRDLIRLGIINSIDQISETDIKLLHYTYPIPTVGLERVKEGIRKVLERYNIFLLGRNGNWDYVNMDGIILNVCEFVAKKFLSVQYPILR